MSKYDQRVANGAQWLDYKFPDWFNKINLDTLDLLQTEYCVCGQIERSKSLSTDATFYKFLFTHNLDKGEANRLGFWLRNTESKREYDILTNTWKRLILKRRKEYERD